jgi:anti-sigma regulatory factor (Ser/Thr protein kinase)
MILEILKLLFSKDFREVVSEIYKLRKSNNWKDGIKSYKGKFAKDKKEEAKLLIDDCVNQLLEMNWTDKDIQNVRFIFWELLNNAFTYSENESKVDLTFSQSFIRFNVTDQGKGFDLKNELIKQGAFESTSYKELRGIGMICRITPEINNSIDKRQHTIRVTLLKGQGNIEVKNLNDITVFILNGSAYDNEFFWNKFVNKLNSLRENSKILISFKQITELPDLSIDTNHSTMAIRKLTKYITEKGNTTKIALFGLETFSFELSEYFKSHFRSFDKLEDAIRYLNNETENT